MADPIFNAHLGRIFLTRAWIFQAIIASPAMIIYGGVAFFAVFDGSYYTIYDFVMYLCESILAAGIIFIVLIQRQLKPASLRSESGKRLTVYFEAAKALLATALWLWALIDAVLTRDNYYHRSERRIAAAGIAFIVLVLFWYPTVAYSIYSLNTHSVEEEEAEDRGQEAAGAATGQGERQPLLGNESV
ncbi:hypothetical protein B0H66DRAFT_62793 [Apodospora peruviana]|uniref:Uncharacterized protein n=1 Tax=Apodospora peruviana TaxID=516989 RepID=A0AAE0MFD6_9PEZI|nr:hypothetical protein B0H66DRAFT_62793 [Apodospora peruviana]